MVDPVGPLEEAAWFAPLPERPRALLLRFGADGDYQVPDNCDALDSAMVEAGVIVAWPRLAPWCWLNRPSRLFLDQLVERLGAVHAFGPRPPLLLAGAGMGGHAALVYARHGCTTPLAVQAQAPCCDLMSWFFHRHCQRRSIRAAFTGCAEDMEQMLVEHSPCHQADAMPDCLYQLIDPAKDELTEHLQIEAMIETMTVAGRRIEHLAADDCNDQVRAEFFIRALTAGADQETG